MRMQSLKRLALAGLIGATALFSGSAFAEDYDDCMINCEDCEGIVRGCHELCETGGQPSQACPAPLTNLSDQPPSESPPCWPGNDPNCRAPVSSGRSCWFWLSWSLCQL